MLLAALNWKSSFSDFMFRGSKNSLKKWARFGFTWATTSLPNRYPAPLGDTPHLNDTFAEHLYCFRAKIPIKKKSRGDCAKSELALRDIASKGGQSYWKVFWTKSFKIERCSAIFSNQNYSAISQPAIMEVLHIPISVITKYWPYWTIFKGIKSFTLECLLGQTRGDRTWDHREAPPAFDQLSWSWKFEKEAHSTLDDILTEVRRPDLVKSLDWGTQATVDTEDLAVDDGGQGEVVEDLCAVPPHLHHS